MADERAFRRLKKTLMECYSTIKTYNQDTRFEDLVAQMAILDATYKECLELERIATVNDDNEKSFDDMYALYNSSRKKILPLHHLLTATRGNQNNDSFSELCENQTEVLKQLLNSTKRDQELYGQGQKIPSFDGNNYSEYQLFRSLFQSIVHVNDNISIVRKLQILKGLCKEKAYNLIKHVEIVEANNETTLAPLDERFGRNKQLLTSYIKRFFEQPCISNPTSTTLHQMYDTSMEILNGVNTMGAAAESRDPWLVLILLNKLEITTRLAWANETENEDFPTIDQFLRFLAKRGNNMEVSYCSSLKSSSSSKSRVMHTNTTSSKSCSKCSDDHLLYECKEFFDLAVRDRRGFVAEHRLCFNCLHSNHQATKCNSIYRCKKCKRKHHTMLHMDDIPQTNEEETKTEVQTESTSQICLSPSQGLKQQAILPTLKIQIKDTSGHYQHFRALIDSGAQNSLISEKCSRSLSLPRKSTNIHISGISGHTFKAKGIVDLSIKSIHQSNKFINVSALIIPKLPSIEPLQAESILQDFRNLPLADPDLLRSTSCDLLIGADKCFSILQPEQHVSSSGIIAQNTIFGWILVGGSTLNENSESSVYSATVNEKDAAIENIVMRFWSIEELHTQPIKTPQDEYIEEFFATNTTFAEGRFTTRIPFKPDAEKLGDSFQIAKRRFLSIERKMQTNPEFKELFTNGIHDYLSKGHMRITTEQEVNFTGEVFYLPHHSVYKLDRKTTKLRIVFDGSCKSTNGVSVNDKMLVGPVIQPTLWQTLMRFRLHRIALTADIQKMYLQVRIHENDQRYQRLLWREDPKDELQHYQLTTVTFGLANSSFLATRTIVEIANDYKNDQTIAAEIKESFYVDDYISGAENEVCALEIKNKLINILGKYGFPLHKWKSNSKSVCQKETGSPHSFDSSTTKVLGLEWCPNTDYFAFNVNLQNSDKITKRTLLSESAQVYEPLGWLSPTIVLFKIIYQQLWLIKVDWDDDLPTEIAGDYKIIRQELSLFQQLQFPRHLKLNSTSQLHGFSDASERAYGAVIYARTVVDDNIFTILVTSKSKVAPTKPTSIARLELCAAQMLAKLMSVTKSTLRIQSDPALWTDSKVVLAWLSEHPSHWKQFVANRCVQIQDEFPRKFWSYLNTKDNPADYVSRGVKPSTLIHLNQWWHGPSWLNERKITECKFEPPSEQGLERERKINKLHVLVAHEKSETIIDQLFKNISTFEKIRRTLAFVLLFIDLKTKRIPISINMVKYLDEATRRCIKWAQTDKFEQEIIQLRSKDENGIIRVGGRLQNANISFHEKHPVIIPKDHELGRTLIRHFHEKNFHCGPSLTHQIMQQQFWLVHSRSTIRKQLRNCVICYKHKPIVMQQVMGQLPSERVNLTRAFHHSGVDYAGPIEMASKTGRGSKIIKGFIAIFVCMATKALHIEVVSELSTSAFLAALTRFVSRRGVPFIMYSDNAKNFIGAKNRLNEVYKLINQTEFNSQVSANLNEQGIQWKFITPLAPHEGGLWEAAVKQVESLLLKTTHGHHFTMEELTTMLCKIEAILNSRPLCVKYNGDVEHDVLTPNHFINGTSSNLIPEEELVKISINRLDRWQLIQKQTQYFWQRYHREYIHTLQQRTKWFELSSNIKVGEIVLLQDEQLPSYKWPLGKVIEVYPGSDGVIRQVLVKTSSSTLKRSIRKLCKVPIELTTVVVNGGGGEDVEAAVNSQYILKVKII